MLRSLPSQEINSDITEKDRHGGDCEKKVKSAKKCRMVRGVTEQEV
jgi:hypothetical protein